ncbi:hypothetical protein GGX14DRAFT_646976 [Mycena pura]|uniref:Uncharacterized protein n=1 Tax=Mycena pura TaxID=153505 RepID=A0AAD6Y7Z4_9AGAR|nr:hypothetical protein GGX14DRAFT_646976 [Mycena pura]
MIKPLGCSDDAKARLDSGKCIMAAFHAGKPSGDEAASGNDEGQEICEVLKLKAQTETGGIRARERKSSHALPPAAKRGSAVSQASNSSMDAPIFEFAPGRSIYLKLVDGTTASYTIVKPFLPFTQSATILARPTAGPNVVIKIHDPRITGARAWNRRPPWDLAVERRAAAAPLRSHGVPEEDDDLYDRLKKDQHTDPDELAALWEEKFYRLTMRSYEKEVCAYDFLVDLQGSMIPRLYSRGVLVVDAGTRAIDIPALVLEYVDGVNLGDAPPELAQQAGDACLALADIVEGFGARGFIHDDISNQNVLLSPRESPTRAVLIDFGGSAVRHHTITDEIWDFTVSVLGDARGLRRLFEKKGIKSPAACMISGYGIYRDPDALADQFTKSFPSTVASVIDQSSH